MDKLQALLRGLRVRQELVFSVREDYEKIVCEVEGNGYRNLQSVVHWPRKRTLCLPAFSDNVNQQVTEKEGERKEEPTSEPLDKQSQPPVEINEDSVSLTSLSSLSSNLPEEEEEATIALQQSTPNTQNYTEREDSATLNESVEVLVDLLHSGPLVRGDLPRNIDSLRDLRLHTEMELMWLRQAIASRRKYLQLKKTQ